jgi:HlyD family secretion protein
MQVKALVEEEKIAVVRPGLPVGVRVEAFPGVEITGRVVKLSEFPEQEMGHDLMSTKLYEATVQIDGGPDGLRPGLSAEVRIGVQRLDRALQLPCQAVFRHGEKDYCLRVRGTRIEPCELTLGPTNGTTVVVRGGLEEGQEVILAAAAHRQKVILPELPGEPDVPGPLAQSSRATLAGLP